ncbi:MULTISPECIES: short-chain-enoyl-CoA hydratase [unclassified Treponema]|uniref:short-chain-enoyl-CoA hydratase n=1 Tax=unclassified Treponema TaxID=2638727 RepID=UPI0005300CE1|nr:MULTISPECIES: short-chain-enoyl-CoA hydratase [unclassified Treponema]AIW88798.1 enoyl-CoA hydratase [Treponema sp. OMZ 838]UTC51255.1 short-chain-enoyl-CoA hydratase [Treponema sp. OMZ 855]
MNTVLFHIDGHIATITINKPQVLNALSTEVLTDLNHALDEVEKAENIYAVILTGAGEKSFVAGADISEMKDKNKAQAAEYGAFGNKVFFRIENFHCPVIAAVNGFALGGGCELAMACDIRIASETARFAQPETGLGITPGFGGTQRLARLVGAGRAKELIYTCRTIKAEEALAIGLVNKVTKPEALMQETLAMAQTICQKAPFAIKQAKAAINKGLQVSIDKAVAVETEEFAQCFTTEDQKMAMNAFVKKEKIEKFNNR